MKKIGSFIIFSIVLFVILCVTFIMLFPKKHQEIISENAKEYRLDNAIVASVINIESGYDENAVSSAGAIGLMQILPSTAEDCASRCGVEIINLFDVSTNIKLGCFYLSYLIDMFEGNIINTLCAYNWGLQNVKDWMSKGNVDSLGTITNIPVKETRDYLKKYKLNYMIYHNFYGY